MQCAHCNAEVSPQAMACPSCGHPAAGTSPKDKATAAILCFFLGGLGIHRFYVGKPWTGILMIVTLGGLGIWTLIDFIRILCGSFSDGQGRKIR